MSAGNFKTNHYEHWRGATNIYGEHEWRFRGRLTGRAWPRNTTNEQLQSGDISVTYWCFAAPYPTPLQVGDEIRWNNRRIKVEKIPTTSSERRIEAECVEPAGSTP